MKRADVDGVLCLGVESQTKGAAMRDKFAHKLTSHFVLRKFSAHLKEDMLVRDNYSYKKYQKELAKKKKKEEKKQSKLDKKNIQASEQASNEDVTVV